MDVSFPVALEWLQLDVKNLSYDQNTRHRSARSNTLPKFRKTNHCSHLYVELNLGSFIKVVDMGVTFILALVW